MRGRFISFEGGEGVGKSTQARLLAETLEARGIDVVTTREPGGTPGAEAIREMLLHPPGQGWEAEAEALLFAAARSDHVVRLIEPSLAAGKWVVCDRFVDSSRAYQGGAGALGDAEILTLHRVGSGGLMPDLTFLLEADEKATAARLERRGEDCSDAIESRNTAYHCQVANAFALLAIAEPERIVRVASSGSIEGTHASVMRALEPLLANIS